MHASSMTSRLRLLAALCLGMVLVGGGAQLGPFAEPASALAAAPVAKPTTPWIGETTRLTGAIGPAYRPVRLQAYSSGAWRTLTTSKTRSGGAYTFSVKAGAKKAYRVYAPRVTLSGRTYSGVVTSTRYVTGVRPTPSVQFSPVNTAGSATGGGYTAGAVAVSPVRAGSVAYLQRWTGTGWQTLMTGTTSSAGVMPFRTDVGTTSNPYTYRAVTRLTSTSTAYAGASRKPSFWKMKWSDEFSGLALSTADWSHRNVGTRAGRRICSTTATANTTVSGGYAHLKITKDSTNQVGASTCPYGTFHNAMIGTQSKHEFTYGVFAARVKMQSPAGMHSSFWLQSEGTPEIDTVEYFGDGRSDGGIAHFLHPNNGGASVGGINAASARFFKNLGADPSDGFHVYSVERGTGAYIFRIDGVEVFRTSQLRSTDAHYLVLSILASDWEIPAMNQSRLAYAKIDVDWVRTWTAS